MTEYINRNKVNLPNFLIVGAAKSGTTSLYHYLKQHPDIYMSPIKEPRFFYFQFTRTPQKGMKFFELIERDAIKTLNDYYKLFESHNLERAVGEASVDNLYYYEGTIQHIKRILGNPKIIIILRNPAERAFSHYIFHLRQKCENLTFENALKREDGRKSDNWYFAWLYKDAGLYYKQVKAYLESFDQVKVFLYDDLKNDSLNLMRDMFNFLNVNDSFVPDSRIKYNISGMPKNKLLGKLLGPNILKTITKKIISDEDWEEMSYRIKVRILKKPEMKLQTREYLRDVFRDDILQLQDLLKKDLTAWLK